MLCDVCEAIFKHDILFTEELVEHHRTYSALESAASTGCSICQRVLRVFESSIFNPKSPTEDSDRYATQWKMHTNDESGEGDLDLFVVASLTGGGSAKAYFKLERTETLANGAEIESNLLEGGTWATIQGWFAECRASHKVCSSIVPGTWRPTRLLDLSNSGVRLVETKHMGIIEPYLSLSHRWGLGDITRTTKETLTTYLDRIGASDLPRTFQDAIVITRKLGFRYLWVDSLCIIQDSPTDWAAEAASMGLVYQNSICNLSALNGSSSHSGLFLPRNVHAIRPTSVRLTLPEGNRQYSGLYNVVDENLWLDNVENAPLNRRGWVLQERILTTRTLFFGRDQVFWNCKEHRACETYPVKLPRAIQNRANESYERLIRISMPRDSIKWTSEDWHRAWKDIVESYSKCSLTHPKDKLPAISGLAKRFYEHLSTDSSNGKLPIYLAGLWSSSLPASLLWRLDVRFSGQSGSPVPSYPSTYRAPSWSWASIDGSISAGGPRSSASFTLATVLEANNTLSSTDLTGQVKDGWIKLKGVIFVERVFMENRRFQHAQIRGKNDKDVGYILYDVRPKPWKAKEKVWCLPLFRTEPDRDTPSITGLALEPATARSQGTYRRWGEFQVSGSDICQDWIRILEDQNKGSKCDLYCHGEDGVVILI